MFFMLLWIAVTIRGRTDRRVVMLLSFSLPVIVLITVQSFISRTHASWTASAAPAASILATAWLLERQRKVLFAITVAVNAVATTAMLVGPILPPSVFPARMDPFARTRGWDGIAAAARLQLATNNYKAMAVDSRELAAELLYYLRDSNIPLFALASRDKPANTFEMTRAYRAGAPEPVLFATLRPLSPLVQKQFRSLTFIGSETIRGRQNRGEGNWLLQARGFSWTLS